MIAGTGIAAAALAVTLVRFHGNLLDLAVVALAVLLFEAQARSFRAGGAKVQFSGHAAVGVAGSFLFGYPVALVAGLAFVLGSVWRRASDLDKLVFNASMSVLMYSAAFATFSGLQEVGDHTVAFLLLAGMAGGIVCWLTNMSLIAAVVWLEQGSKPLGRGSVLGGVAHLIPYYLVYGLTGVGVVAASHEVGPIAALITFTAPIIIIQVATSRWVHEQEAHAHAVAEGFNATLISLSKAIDLRDHETEGHCRRVVEYTRLMAVRMGITGSELTRLCHGALLHDIGKIGVPDGILHKPGALTEAEWQVIRQHPELGAQMVADVEQLEHARMVITNHHERYDGSGYPRGLRGEAIPLGARIFAIADSFDAMTSTRPYRKGLGLAGARQELRRCAGSDFDPQCVEVFLSFSDEEVERVIKQREQADMDLLAALPILRS